MTFFANRTRLRSYIDHPRCVAFVRSSLDEAPQRRPPPTRRHSAHREKKKRPRTRGPEALQPDRQCVLLFPEKRNAAHDFKKRFINHRQGLTVQTISYANLKCGLTRRSVSFRLRQSIRHELSPKPSFLRLPLPTAGMPQPDSRRRFPPPIRQPPPRNDTKPDPPNDTGPAPANDTQTDPPAARTILRPTHSLTLPDPLSLLRPPASQIFFIWATHKCLFLC